MATLSSISTIILLLVVILFGFCSIGVKSLHDIEGLIRLPTELGGDGGVCANFDQPASCPVKCFRADPVCGDDGVTYWCGCSDALCNGVRVAKLGFCDTNGGRSSVPGQAFLLIHIVWLILLGFSLLLGLPGF